MNFLKKLLGFVDDSCAIGLCKFNSNPIQEDENEKFLKKTSKKDLTLTQMLKKDI